MIGLIGIAGGNVLNEPSWSEPIHRGLRETSGDLTAKKRCTMIDALTHKSRDCYNEPMRTTLSMGKDIAAMVRSRSSASLALVVSALIFVFFSPSAIEGQYPIPDDHADNQDEATVLTESVDGVIGGSDDIDWFRFDVVERQDITLWSSGNLHTLGLLIDRYNKQRWLRSDRSGRNFWMSRTLEPGTYYLYIRSRAWGEEGRYRVHFDRAHWFDIQIAPDNHADERSGATELTADLEGIIGSADDVDYFRFDIAERQVATLWSSGFVDTIGELERVAADGRVDRIAMDDGDDSRINFRLSRTLGPGTYYLKVTGQRRPAWYDDGHYAVHLRHTDVVPDDHADERIGATELTSTGSVMTWRSLEGQIYPADDVDYFQVNVPERQHVVLSTSGNLDTVGALERVSGGSVESIAIDDDYGIGNNFAMSQPLEPGTYYLKVTGRGSSDTGSYQVHRQDFVVVIDDDHAGERSGATELMASASGVIDHPVDIDYFKFTVVGRRKVVTILSIEIDGPYGGNHPTYITLERVASDRRFEHITTRLAGGVTRISQILGPGKYYVRVRGADPSRLDTRIRYIVNRIDLPVEADDHANERSGATELITSVTDRSGRATGGTAGMIGTPGDVDYFRFDIAARQVVRIWSTSPIDSLQITIGTMERVAADGSVKFIEFDEAGEQEDDLEPGVRNTWYRRADPQQEIDFKFSPQTLEPGTYYIRVEGWRWDSTGSYELHRHDTDLLPKEIPDDHADERNGATELTTFANGVITSSDDVDYFQFDVVERQAIDLRITGDVWAERQRVAADGHVDRFVMNDPFGTRNPSTSSVLEPGAYYIKVDRYRDRSSSPVFYRVILNR